MTIYRKIDDTRNDKTPVAIGQFDMTVVEGTEYTLNQRTTAGYHLNVNDMTGRSRFFPHEELRNLARNKRVRHHPGHFRPEAIARRAARGYVEIGKLKPKPAARLAYKSAIVEAINELYAARKIKLTDDSIASHLSEIMGLALQNFDHAAHRTLVIGAKSYNPKWRPSPSIMRKWRTAHEEGGEGVLVDRIGMRGGSGTSLHPEVSKILWSRVMGYLNRAAPSQQTVYLRIRADIFDLNDRCLESHLASGGAESTFSPLKAPCRATEPRRVCRRLQHLSRMEHHEQNNEQVFP